MVPGASQVGGVVFESMEVAWFCLRQFFILGLTKVPFRDFLDIVSRFLSKSKVDSDLLPGGIGETHGNS